jgi:PadR family transcriptional regulator PadR
MKSFKETLLKSLLPYIILEKLSVEPAHGYAFISLLRKRYGVYLGPSTIYPLLNMLEDEGYVESEWVISKSGKPQKVYKITVKGKAFLGQATAELTLLVKPQLEVKA